MSDLIVIVYPTAAQAGIVRNRLLEQQREYLVTLENTMIATLTEDDTIRFDQLMKLTAGGLFQAVS